MTVWVEGQRKRQGLGTVLLFLGYRSGQSLRNTGLDGSPKADKNMANESLGV